MAEAIKRLCEATANALHATDRHPLVAHLFSVLPKIGLDEAMVPEPLLAQLRLQRSGSSPGRASATGAPGPGYDDLMQV